MQFFHWVEQVRTGEHERLRARIDRVSRTIETELERLTAKPEPTADMFGRRAEPHVETEADARLRMVIARAKRAWDPFHGLLTGHVEGWAAELSPWAERWDAGRGSADEGLAVVHRLLERRAKVDAHLQHVRNDAIAGPLRPYVLAVFSALDATNAEEVEVLGAILAACQSEDSEDPTPPTVHRELSPLAPPSSTEVQWTGDPTAHTGTPAPLMAAHSGTEAPTITSDPDPTRPRAQRKKKRISPFEAMLRWLDRTFG